MRENLIQMSMAFDMPAYKTTSFIMGIVSFGP